RLTLRFRRQEKSHAAVANTAEQGMSAMIGKPESYARKEAMTNLFFLCHKHQLMFLGISKNASTTLKHIMYREEFGADTQEVPAEIHRFWGWGPHADRAIETHKAKDVEAYSGYTRFAIYRDPVSRFLSAYHNMVLYSKVPHEFFVENRLEGMALDHFIDVTATILKMNNPLHIDEHLRPQAWQYRPDDVDYIVPLESMSDFLESRFGIQPGPVHNKTRLPRISASEQQLERIREIYACDYAIKPNWPDSGTVQKKPPGIVDLRKLEAPEPMEKILMACARLGPEDNFQARLPHVPGPLFPHLEARGLDWKIHQERDGSTLITIWRRS
ncbi:MAG: sulfotransferase family 2 domain-containing protein, partial [Xanthomonadales bacterium]|nr:sulfotransferase family 2 domain-containing protein [Xanthomonadales bacterium]